MAWWNKLGQKIADFFLPERRLPEKRRKRAERKPQTERQLPRERERVTREPKRDREKEYRETLGKLRSEQQQKRELERVMFDDGLPLAERKAALDEYNTLTGWWRPTNNNEWSSDEWKRWEEIYESEPEVF